MEVFLIVHSVLLALYLMCINNRANALLAAQCRVNVSNNIEFSVDCAAMNLTEVPRALKAGPILRLDLSSNFLSDIMFSQFVNWTNIFEINLSWNNLQNIAAGAFVGLDTLYSLDLSHNKLTLISYTWTADIPNLKLLNVTHNQITSLDSNSFSVFRKLDILSLGYNPSFTEYKMIIALKHALVQGLVHLNLDSLNITDSPQRLFDSVVSLRKLSMKDNPMASVPLLPSSIYSLDLSGTNISELGQGAFDQAPQLRILVLERSVLLTSISADVFQGVPNLQSLSFSGSSRLNQLDHQVFLPVHNLKHLSLARCSFETLDRKLQKSFAHLSSLDLQGNPWNCNASTKWLARLKIVGPDVRCARSATNANDSLVEYFAPRAGVHSLVTRLAGALCLLTVAVPTLILVIAFRKQRKQRYAKLRAQLRVHSNIATTHV